MGAVLFAALLVAGGGARAEGAFHPGVSAWQCPPEQRIKVDLPAWKAQLPRFGPGSREQKQFLHQLNFADVPDNSDEIPEVECIKTPRVEGVDLFNVNLRGGAQDDTVVQVRFRMCQADDGQNEFISQRIAVLVPLGQDMYCRLSGDLSHDQAAWDHPCLGKAARLPRLISFVNLTDVKRKTIQLKDQNGKCDGIDRSAVYTTRYLEVRGARVVPIFEFKSYEASYQSPHPPAQETVRTIKPVGGWPKKLEQTEEVRCLPPIEGEPPSDCKPRKKQTVFSLEEGKYQPQRR